MAAASSSTSFFGIREENQSQITHHHPHPQSTTTSATSSAPSTTVPQKKRRNQPGTPSKYLNYFNFDYYFKFQHAHTLLEILVFVLFSQKTSLMKPYIMNMN